MDNSNNGSNITITQIAMGAFAVGAAARVGMHVADVGTTFAIAGVKELWIWGWDKILPEDKPKVKVKAKAKPQQGKKDANKAA